MPFKSDILDIRMVVHGETERAVRVSEDGDLKKSIWLPLSQIEIEPVRTENGVRYADLQVPQWLAEKVGLA